LAIRLAEPVRRLPASPAVAMTTRAARLREAGRDVISLSAGEPDFDTPEHVKAAARAAIDRGETKYTPVDGTRRLKDAVAAKFRRDNGLEYRPEQILVTSGAKQSCFNACLALLGPGDEAVVLAPYWVSYPELVRIADAVPVIVSAGAEQRFRVTPEQLAAALTERTRLVILNSPCNPTGAMYSRAELEALGEVLRRHEQVTILADDIYEHIHWSAEPFVSFAAACPDLYDRTITVNGVSKCYAMSGWRIGYAAGPAEVIKAMTAIQTQSTTNASSIAQAAAAAALDGDQTVVREMCAAFRQRHELVVERMRAPPGFDCLRADGTFYVFPNIERAIARKGLANDVEFCEQLLEAEGVALVPGSAFGAPGHLRMSFAADASTLNEALDRMARFVGA